jgi:integrase
VPRKTLSDRGVAALKPRQIRYAHPDPEMSGHYVRVTPNGAKSFAAVTIGPDGKQKWITIGKAGVISIAEARERAREAVRRVKAGLAAFEVPPGTPETFKQVAERWLTREVRAKQFRSAYHLTRLLDVHVLPRWGDRPFVGIRRSDITTLLDHVEDNHGATQADSTLGVIRSMMYWFASRTDDYAPPVTRGMKRTSTRHQARARVLNDMEIRQLWEATEGTGNFNGIARLCLLTAQRSRKVASMRWSDLSGGEWTIRSLPREKGTAVALVLPELALDVIKNQPRIENNEHIFAATRGVGPFHDWGLSKDRLDAKLGVPSVAHDKAIVRQAVPSFRPFVIHDLRRTARSLMSRAGVPREIAERVLGHAIRGVEGVYDRHEYRDEKADALARLAALIDSIINPRDNVIPIRK